MKNLFSLFFLCFTSSTLFLSGQEIFNFQFKKYQVNDGMSENTVACLQQDDDGFIWIGTKDGLNKFDGNKFTVYRNREQDESSIGNNYVKCIIPYNKDEFFIGTDDGLYFMDTNNETFERLESKLNIADKLITSISSMLLDQSGKLWITTMYQGVYMYDPEKIELNRIRSNEFDFTKSSTWSVFQDRSGTIWVGTRGGLFQYNPGSMLLEGVDYITNFNNTSDKEIISIYEDEKGNLWLGTWSDGILFYNKHDKPQAFCNNNSADYYITHIRAFLQYDESHLLIGADDGLYLFNMNSKKCKRIDLPYNRHSLSDQNVYSMLRDNEGGIWIGTYFGGLNYINPSTHAIEKYQPNDKPGFLSGKAVSQFCEDKNGNIWIATEDGGLNYFNPKTKEITQPIQTSYHNIHPLILVDDELWIGTFSRGIDVYNVKTKKLRNYSYNPENENSLNDDCVFALYQAKAGEIYVGTTKGLNKYNKAKDSFIRLEEDSITFVYDIKEDSFRNLWIASYNTGAIKWDPVKEKWTHYSSVLPKNNRMVDSKLIGIYVDVQKRLWFCSDGRGIFMYDQEKDDFINISEKDGLPNNVVYGILDDQFGNLWVSSNQGLACFPPNDITSQKRYSQEDGLQSNEFNYKASFKSSDGKLYFGGINGFNCFYPQELSKNVNSIIPPVVITDIQLLSRSNEETEKYLRNCIINNKPVRLKHYNSSLQISYVCLSYVAQLKNQYAYKLNGIDENWNHVGNNKSVTYVNLPPGKYTFQVKASNNNNVWNEEGTVLKFEILPPFWLSVPIKILYLVLLLVSIYAISVYFIKKSRKKQLQQLEHYKAEQETLAFKSKIDFFTTIAHEIRTPVSLIKAPLEEIIDSGDGNENTKQNLSIIEKNSERLNVLINQLLDFRKMDVSEHKIHANRMNLKKHITELYERFRKTAQSQKTDLKLIVPKTPEIWIISDADALTKITGNFLTNALKHTTDKIVLRLKEEGKEKFTIAVEDNGKGIPAEQKKAIFDPFYQIESYEKKKGTGIGLFLAKHLSEVLGGEIEVLDNPTGGSIFSFSFESLPEERLYPEEIPENSSPEETPYSFNLELSEKKTILVVEDNIEMLHFISNSLRNEHYVDTAENGAIALEKIEKKSYDLIITDIMMPDIDGLEFTQKLRNNVNYSHIPIIVLSAKTDNNTKIESLKRGADIFIEKPFSTSHLKAQISSLIANRRAILEVFNKSPFTSYSILTSNKSDLEFISRLNEEIDKNISDSTFSIESLTDKLFISRSNLQRKLKSICGFTPGDYLRTYRLKKAASLLIEDGLRINEVAFEVGFSSPSYFTKCFIKQFGMVPKDFIKQHNKEETS